MAAVQLKVIDLLHPQALRVGMAVYFIQAALEDGPIKIGVSRTPGARLQYFRSHSPVELVLLYSCPSGADRLAKALQQQFQHLRLHGAWFRPTKELFDAIEHLRRADEDPTYLATVAEAARHLGMSAGTVRQDEDMFTVVYAPNGTRRILRSELLARCREFGLTVGPDSGPTPGITFPA